MGLTLESRQGSIFIIEPLLILNESILKFIQKSSAAFLTPKRSISGMPSSSSITCFSTTESLDLGGFHGSGFCWLACRAMRRLGCDPPASSFLNKESKEFN